MRICFLIPDGVGIRNYLYSDLISLLTKDGHEVVLWHSLDPEMIQITENRIGIKLEQYKFEHKADGVGIQLLRESARYARIQLNAKQKNNPTILTNWSGLASSRKGKFLNKGAEILGRMIKTYEGVASVEKKEFDLISRSSQYVQARKFLSDIKPDLLFCTHQRVFSVTAATEAAKSIGIPTSTAIFSWDNLPKGRLPFRVDQYLVWSEYMKEELKDYYPEISELQIEITGSPQFDFYLKEDLIMDKSTFGEKFGLDSFKEWVCYSGCDTITSPNDPSYLRDVASALENDKSIQLIFRPVPVEPVTRFEKILEAYPGIKLLEPLWVKGKHWGNYFPKFEDIQLLVNMAFHCKVVVNMGSTMALDFSTFGNAGLYLNYDHSDGKPGWSVDTIYKFQHFRSMGDWKAVGWIYSPDEILQKVKEAMQNPDAVAPDRKKWFEKIVQPDPKVFAAERVKHALLSLPKSKV